MAEKRVLLVDDNPSDRMIVKALLAKSGLMATEAADAHEALETLNDETLEFALFVIDLQMPKVSGHELVKRLRRMERTKKTPILIMSGRNRPIDIQTSIMVGANDYIIKPMDLQILEEKVDRLTKGSSGQWNLYEVPKPVQVAEASILISILKINELGAEVRMSFEMPKDHTFTFTFDPLGQKGLKECLAKVESVVKTPEGFAYKISFVGLTEADRKKIRLTCREFWTRDEEEGEEKAQAPKVG